MHPGEVGGLSQQPAASWRALKYRSLAELSPVYPPPPAWLVASILPGLATPRRRDAPTGIRTSASRESVSNDVHNAVHSGPYRNARPAQAACFWHAIAARAGTATWPSSM